MRKVLREGATRGAFADLGGLDRLAVYAVDDTTTESACKHRDKLIWPAVGA
jgi:hypothetical protein